jgi:peptidoglycan/xylan/chitin deacetylase (PgdA/CDA1 family)
MNRESNIKVPVVHRKAAVSAIGKSMLPVAGKYLFLNRILTMRHRHDPIVLCYHSVVPDEIAEDPQQYGCFVSVSEFSEQMSVLARSMTPISLAAFQEWHYHGRPLPENPVLVTFDDGYRNNLAHAAPILLRYEIPATFFLTVSHIGGGRLLWPTEVYRAILNWPSPDVPLPDGSSITVAASDLQKRTALAGWVRQSCKALSEERKNEYLARLREPAFPALTSDEAEMFGFLSWDEAMRLQELGFVLGSHTMEHCILTRVHADHLHRELQSSKNQIEGILKSSCAGLAYPNGGSEDCSPQVFSAAGRAGYKLGFTTRPGACTRHTDPLALNRICIPGKLSRLTYESRISGLHDLLRSSFR